MRPIQHPPGSQSTSTAAKPRSVVREGIAAGAVAATGVALLYLAADLLVGMPLVTQRLLGAGVAALLGLQLTVGTSTGAVLQSATTHAATTMCARASSRRTSIPPCNSYRPVRADSPPRSLRPVPMSGPGRSSCWES